MTTMIATGGLVYIRPYFKAFIGIIYSNTIPNDVGSITIYLFHSTKLRSREVM